MLPIERDGMNGFGLARNSPQNGRNATLVAIFRQSCYTSTTLSCFCSSECMQPNWIHTARRTAKKSFAVGCFTGRFSAQPTVANRRCDSFSVTRPIIAMHSLGVRVWATPRMYTYLMSLPLVNVRRHGCENGQNKFHFKCKLRSSSAQLMLWEMHLTNLSVSIEAKYRITWGEYELWNRHFLQ